MRTIWIFIVPMLLFGSVLLGADYRGSEIVRVAKTDTIPSDLFVGSRSVYVDGVIRGDLYAGCETVTINGTVEEDVVAACRRLVVRGVVGDQVIGFAESILIDGEVFGDLLAYGGSVRLTDKAIIHGNVYVGTGDFSFDGGRIEGSLIGGAGKLFLNGYVGEKTVMEGGKVEFGENYQAGDGTELTLPYQPDRATMTFLPDDLQVTVEKDKPFYAGYYFWWSMAAMFVVGVLLTVFFKHSSREYLAFAQQQVLKNLGIGFLALVAAPIAVVILLILIVTIPVGLMGLAIYLVLLYLAYVLSAAFLGNQVMGLMGKQNGQGVMIWSLLLGVILLSLVGKIPYLGGLFELLVICFGMGSLLAFLWQQHTLNGKQPA